MKRILSFAVLFAFALCINAQQRKTWDFTKGISDATLENLVADEANWTITYNNDGVFDRAADKTKIYGELTANGIVIEELRGIKFGSGGLSKNNNWLLCSNRFRMSRKGSSFSLRVAPGQTITMKARSANSTAPDRGFVGDANMEYISGPENGVCPGGEIEAEGRDERGDFTLVWKVKDEIEGLEGDSLDVSIKTSPNGGLDISLIQIDEGDNPQKTSVDIAYIYDSSYPGYTLDEDIPYGVMALVGERLAETEIKPIDIAGDMSTTTRETLEGYNVVVVSNAISSTNPFVTTLKSAVAYTPMLVFSPALYETWGYGKAHTTGSKTLFVNEGARNSALFTPSDENIPSYIDENGNLSFFSADGEDAVMGYEVEEGSYFAKDDVLATADEVNAIHIHNPKRNAYMMLPYHFGMTGPDDNLSDIIPNAVIMLNKTKTEVTNAAKPVVKEVYHNLSTTVSLTCTTANNKVYYTLDGSEPTTASTLYTTPFDVNEKDVVVKAFAVADGYNPSDVREQLIAIHELAKAPEITYAQVDDTVEVTLASVAEDAVVYYNFTGSGEIAQSSVYESPVKLTKHATITAFTGAYGDYLQSETVSKDIVVKGEKVRMDIVSHMDANKTDWTPAGANPTYYNGKNGHAYYSDDVLEQTTDPDSGEEIFVCSPANVVVYVNPGKGWEVRTEAQAMFWQNNGCTHNVGDGNGYNPETALDDDVNATSSCISFGSSSTTNSFGTKNPAYTGSIQSTEAFQGPFDIVANVANTAKNGGNITAYAYVTTDTLSGEWTELGELKTSTTGRLWKNTVLGYEGTDKVFVKVCASNSVGIFDIFIKNEGELSKEYIANVNGIENVNAGASGEVVRTMIYSINGTQLDKAGKGINIVKEVYANGAVKTKKVIVK